MSIFIGINPGKGKDDIATSASATTGKALELTFDETKFANRNQLLAELEHIRGRIAVGKWPNPSLT
jgi:hypothetical protein